MAEALDLNGRLRALAIELRHRGREARAISPTAPSTTTYPWDREANLYEEMALLVRACAGHPDATARVRADFEARRHDGILASPGFWTRVAYLLECAIAEPLGDVEPPFVQGGNPPARYPLSDPRGWR